MKARQQELLNRLIAVTDTLYERTDAPDQFELVFEGFVSTMERIALDLAITSDEKLARKQRQIAHFYE